MKEGWKENLKIAGKKHLFLLARKKENFFIGLLPEWLYPNAHKSFRIRKKKKILGEIKFYWSRIQITLTNETQSTKDFTEKN